MELIHKYFPGLSPLQIRQFDMLGSLYREWNEQINVISRKDMDNFYERHVLHSLGIARVSKFLAGAEILDVGTGGGFPGIPLAILFPEARFHLVDSIGKKIKVVDAVAEALELKNVSSEQIRAEQLKSRYNFVVSRAVTKLPVFLEWISGKFKEKNMATGKHNGVLYLKGGDLDEELEKIKFYRIYDLNEFFEEEFFDTKKVVYIPASAVRK